MRFTDIHCHILPGLDDGAYSEDDFLNMAEVAEESGTEAIICTSHAYAGGGYSGRKYDEVLGDMRERLLRFGIGVSLYPGQEIFIDGNSDEVLREIRAGHLLTLCGTGYVLIEFDFETRSEAVFRAVRTFKDEGLVPIIAHPERYFFLSESPEKAERLHEEGALLQLNAGSAGGFFGPEAEDTAHYLLGERLADFAASDAHSPYVRTPELFDAYEYACDFCSPGYADTLFITNPRKIINNEKITPYRR